MITAVLRRCLCVLLLAAPLSVHAEVNAVWSIEELEHQWDQDEWFLVDLDNCLFQSRQALGHAEWFYEKVRERMAHGMSKNEAIMDMYPLWVKVQERCEVQPVEEALIELVHRLQNRGITVIGLTHRQPCIADTTARQVASLGVDFTTTAPSPSRSIVFQLNGPAEYRDGIIFVGDCNSKGDVLAKFFDEVGYVPPRATFIDDQRKNVDDLDTVLNQMGIAFFGIHYRAVEDSTVYDSDLAAIQWYYFNKILSNEEALLVGQPEL